MYVMSPDVSGIGMRRWFAAPETGTVELKAFQNKELWQDHVAKLTAKLRAPADTGVQVCLIRAQPLFDASGVFAGTARRMLRTTTPAPFFEPCR
jgi:hypothetical protein